jgi:hypothetical protein
MLRALYSTDRVLHFRAMATALTWIEALAGFKALYDLIKSGADYAQSVRRHRTEPDTITEANRVSRVFSTYSDREIQELVNKIEGCRDRFISQGSGKDRARCLCSIFQEIMHGNGGQLPTIDAWQQMYDELKCGG